MTALRVGVIGLGEIGGGLSIALTRSGTPPAVYDLRAESVQAINGATRCGTAAEVATRSDLVFIAVVDAQQVNDVLFGPTGVVSGVSGDITVVVLSTISLSALTAISERVSKTGIRLADAGVTGHQGAASKGELVFLLGGEAADADKIAEVLKHSAKDVIHVGPLGAGLSAKIARNLITYGTWLVVQEACDIANAAGVDTAILIEAVRRSDPDGSMQFLLAQMPPGVVTGEKGQASMRQMAILMDKDLAAAEELAVFGGVSAGVANLARANGRRVLGLSK